MIADQATLFGPPELPKAEPANPPLGHAGARATDPDTSKTAAEVVDNRVTEQCLQVLWALVQCETHGGHGATAHEVVLRLAYGGRAPQQNVAARRLTTLQRVGLVRDTGDRRPGSSPAPLIVWASTVDGRERVAA